MSYNELHNIIEAASDIQDGGISNSNSYQTKTKPKGRLLSRSTRELNHDLAYDKELTDIIPYGTLQQAQA